jgi:hypothetical protein
MVGCLCSSCSIAVPSSIRFERSLFCPLNYTLKEGVIAEDLIQGGMMAGSISSIRWWTSVFYETVREYQSRNVFIGIDEFIINAIALVHADRLNMLLSFRMACGNAWVPFTPLLSEKSEREKLSYSVACQKQDTSTLIIPFETVCSEKRNFE